MSSKTRSHDAVCGFREAKIDSLGGEGGMSPRRRDAGDADVHCIRCESSLIMRVKKKCGRTVESIVTQYKYQVINLPITAP